MPGAESDNRWKHGFWGVWATQFQESFNDNAYRWLVVSYVIGMGLSSERQDFLTNAATVLFSLPFILFSPAGGYLADRYSKRSVILGTKLTELPIMGLALLGLVTRSIPVMFAALFLRGIQSSCYSPSKFGMLPEVLPEKRLSWGNGVIELGSFLAIICGTVAGTSMYSEFRLQLGNAGTILIATTLIGLMAAATLPRTQVARTTRHFHINPFGELIEQWSVIRRDRTLYLAVLGNTYFFLLAALLQTTVLYYGKFVLNVSEGQIGYLQGAIAVGIGVGSFAAGYLSCNKIEYGLIPLGSAGITILAIVLSLGGFSFAQVAIILLLMGFSAGFFAVPINAIIQHRPDPEKKGGVIGASNQLSFIGIAVSALLHFVLSSLGFQPPAIFLFGGLMTLVATIYTIILVPDSLLRLLVWILVHSVYRIQIQGRDNIPAKGGALFVCNHLSLIDALLLGGATERHIRFLMYKGYYDRPLIGLFARAAGAIPISSEQRRRDMIQSMRTASDAICNGQVVCIFAEGQMTRTGQLLPFRRGFERIMEGVDAPIIPVHLDGLWGSIFSFERGRYFWKLPKRALRPITVSYGAPLPSTSTAIEVHQAVQQL
jgi:acyl-[acyl-carrier-protein]-phospholipid O-acyltransferase / long-chain-fatty-acid--[acyl-carrier-protein] ligase